MFQIKHKIYKYYISKRFYIVFGKNVSFNKSMIFEGNNAIYNNTIILDSYLGYGSYVANQSNIKKTKIGRYCAIGDNVRTCLGLHPTSNFVSIHPAFFSLNKQAGFTFVDKQLFEEHKYIDNTKKYVVEIGNDVWIGNNVLIMDGIKIGDGAVIAAGAVITKDVAPYSIVGGVPAKHIKYRFEQEDIDFLLQFKWWEKSPEWIKKNASAFISINLFRNI